MASELAFGGFGVVTAGLARFFIDRHHDMFGNNVGVESKCGSMLLGKQVNDHGPFEFFVEHGREIIVPPARKQSERRKSGPHLEAIVGHGFIGANRT